MSERLDKYRAEKDKNSEKIAKLQARNRELDRLITETENTEIVSMMRSQKISIEDFAAYLQTFRSDSGASFTIPKQEETVNEE